MISLFLYGIGLLGDSYYAFAQMNPSIESIYQAMFSLFDSTRKGCFFAPVFVMLGGLIDVVHGWICLFLLHDGYGRRR